MYIETRQILQILQLSGHPVLKLNTECKFTFKNSLYQQIDGCTMGGPFSVTFSDTYMVKLENDTEAPLRPKFYRRYVDMFNERKVHMNDIHFKPLNIYHPKSRLTIELNPKKFL